MPDALRLEGVWKAFSSGSNKVVVLEDVSLSVAPGTIAAIVGSRAQGKTTALRIASGMLPADRGDVFVGGRDLAELSDAGFTEVLANDIGIAIRSERRQWPPPPRFDVHAYVELKLVATKRWSSRERRRRVATVLKDLGIQACARIKLNELSNWQRVLVELAQAAVVRPRLLLVDNLVDGLDLGKKQATMELLQGFAQDIGCGVLMAVSDHAAALTSEQVWQLSGARLKLMHTGPDVIDLRLRRDRGSAQAADA